MVADVDSILASVMHHELLHRAARRQGARSDNCLSCVPGQDVNSAKAFRMHVIRARAAVAAGGGLEPLHERRCLQQAPPAAFQGSDRGTHVPRGHMESVRLACVPWPLLWILHLLLAWYSSARPVVCHPDRSMRVQYPPPPNGRVGTPAPGQCVLYVYIAKRWSGWGDAQVLSTLDVRTARAPWLPPGPKLVHLPCNYGIGTVHGPPRTSLLHAVRVVTWSSKAGDGSAVLVVSCHVDARVFGPERTRPVEPGLGD
jgi:hypothetical protein